MVEVENEPFNGTHPPAAPQVLIIAGLLAGLDMTPEAALSKLSYVLAQEGLDLQTKKKVGLAFRFTFKDFCRCFYQKRLTMSTFVRRRRNYIMLLVQSGCS